MTPESDLADFGLLTLDVSVTATGFEGVPETLESSRCPVTVTAAEATGEFEGGVTFIQPSFMSADEVLALMMSDSSDETGGVVRGDPAGERVAGGTRRTAPIVCRRRHQRRLGLVGPSTVEDLETFVPVLRLLYRG